MGILWSKVDINEELNKNKRAISKAIREIDREIQKLQQEEVKLQKEIRNAIEKGYTESAKIFSKDILKIRRQIERLNIARSQLMCAELKLTSVKSQIQVNNTLSDLNNVMGKVNGLTELSSIQNILKNYAKEADKFDVKGDIINDSIDAALGNDLGFEDEDELAEKIYKEVYDSVELGKQRNNSNVTKTKNLNVALSKNSDTQNFDANTEFETNGKEKDFESCISIEERIKRLGEGRRG